MKSQPLLKMLIWCLFLSIMFSCTKTEEEKPIIRIIVESETEVSETSFVVNWNINSAAITSIKIELSDKINFSTVLKTVSVSDVSKKSRLIDSLKGASRYYYKIVAEADGQIVTSDVKNVTTSYKTETVSFTTSDGYKIAARLKYLESKAEKSPGIICMHELGVFVNNWNNNELVTSLIANGFVCMVLDFRGHGQSDDFDLQDIASDLSMVVPDLHAAIQYLKNHPAVETENIALMGGSLGAIMSIAGNGYDEVKCSVALSGARIGIYSIFPEMEINSAFFVAGELDINANADFAEEASKLYEIAVEPKKLKIIPGISAHGTDLLGTSGIKEEIEDWLITNLSE